MNRSRWYVMPRLELVTDDIETAKHELADILEQHGWRWVNSKTAQAFMVDEAEKPLPPIAKPPPGNIRQVRSTNGKMNGHMIHDA